MVRKQRRRISYVLPLANSAGGHRLGINGLAVDSNNSILYSGGRDGVICAWQLDSPRNTDADSLLIRDHTSSSPLANSFKDSVQAHTHWINDVKLVNYNEALVSASSDISVKLWNTTQPFSQKNSITIGSHRDYVKCLSSPSSDSNWVASGGLDRKICLWNLNGAGSVLELNNSDEGDPSTKGSVYALATTRSLVSAGGPENVVRLWDARSGTRVTKLVGHSDMIRSILLAEDGENVISASSDSTIKVWSLREGRCMYTMTMHNDSVWDLHSNDPSLGVFWSCDKSGVIAKTDMRNRAQLDDSVCVYIGREENGVFRIIESNNNIWAASTSSSLNCWKDVSTEGNEISLPEPIPAFNRGSLSSMSKQRPRNPSLGGDSSKYGHSTPTRQNSSVAPSTTIPNKHLLRISNTATFPILRRHESDNYTLPPYIRRKSSTAEYEEVRHEPRPFGTVPYQTIIGQSGLIKHITLNDKRRVVTLDQAGDVMLWDLISCMPLRNYGKQDIDDIIHEINTMESVAPWCSVNTKIGCLTVVLEENSCFDAEMYADELEISENIEFKEDQRINLGKWVLRYLFENLVNVELQQDERFRQTLFNSKQLNHIAGKETSRPIPPPLVISQTQLKGWTENPTPTSASAIRSANGLHHPQSLGGLAIGLSTPGGLSSKNTTMSSVAQTGPGEMSPKQTPSERTSSDQHNHDYFSRPPTGGVPGSPTASSTTNGRLSGENPRGSPTLPNTESEDKSGLFSKKFRGMNLITRGFKKEKTDKTPIANEAPQDTNPKINQIDDRLNEDSLYGSILRIRHSYEMQNQLTIKDVSLMMPQSGNSIPQNKPLLIATAFSPSIPNDTPTLKIPIETIILIQEDKHDSGGVADLWEGTVRGVGQDHEAVEQVAPSWLADVLLRNIIPPKDLVKISFILEPWQASLPPVSTEASTRLNANRMLRARKILSYIAERIEPASQTPEPNVMKPEDYLELYCQNQLIPPKMTLATIQTHIWRGRGDVLLIYKANGRKSIAHTPKLVGSY